MVVEPPPIDKPVTSVSLKKALGTGLKAAPARPLKGVVMDQERSADRDRTDLKKTGDIIQSALEGAGFKVTLVEAGATQPGTVNPHEPAIWGIEGPNGSELSLTLNVTQ